MNTKKFSEELVQQLAVRDELDFEKEVKNIFISVLIDVQNRQKEHRESLKKKKKLKDGAGTGQGGMERTPALVMNGRLSLSYDVQKVCLSLFPTIYSQAALFSFQVFTSSCVSSTSFLPSASAWRESPPLFKTASGKHLEVGAVNDRLRLSATLSTEAVLFFSSCALDLNAPQILS